MASELQSISSGDRGIPAAASNKAAAPPPSAAPVPAAPKIAAPKPVDIQFDEAKARKNVQEAVSELNHQMVASKTGLGFTVDESLGRPIVTVRNTVTGEVVRQIPNDVVIKVAHSIDEMKGLFLNTKV